MAITSMSIEEEISHLLEFLLETAKTKNTGEFFLTHDEIKDHIVNDGNQINRIRWSLDNELQTHGVVADFVKGKNGGYNFIIENFESIKSPTIVSPVGVQNIELNNDIHSTFTKYATDYVYPPEFRDILSIVKNNIDNNSPVKFFPYIWGDWGCGKTRACEEALAYCGVPYLVDELTAYTSMDSIRESLIGSHEAVNGTTVFVKGLIPRCAEEGKAIIFNELDRMSKRCSMIFQHIAVQGASLVLRTEKGVEVVPFKSPFTMLFTGNTQLYGDHTGHYTSCEPMDRSTISRLGPKINMNYNIGTEADILKGMLPTAIHKYFFNQDKDDPTNVGLIVQIREMIHKNEINDKLSTRTLIKFAQLYKIYGWHRAMFYGFLADIHPDFQDVVVSRIKEKKGEEFVPTNDMSLIEKYQDKLNKEGFA